MQSETSHQRHGHRLRKPKDGTAMKLSVFSYQRALLLICTTVVTIFNGTTPVGSFRLRGPVYRYQRLIGAARTWRLTPQFQPQPLASACYSAPKRGFHEFDDILTEGSSSSSFSLRNKQALIGPSRRRIALERGSNDVTTGTPQRVVLASSSAFPGTSLIERDALSSSEDDPYANALDTQLGKIEQYQEQRQTNTLEARFKTMDLQDIVLTLILPGIVVFAASRWLFGKVGSRVTQTSEETMDNFAQEMIYHDGDFKEMELCVKDYKTKLMWMGPTKSDAMLKRYLESYAKKKTVSPQAIASLSYVFTIFKLSEEKAANILVALCRSMGTDKISSAGKLLFLGSRILKSPQGKAALQPIKTLIMSTYRDERVAESLVETSQQAIAEAAYRTAVLSSGKNQDGLSPGWEVLGLTRESASRIWDLEKKEGFLSDRETMYGGQTRKYDKQGRQLDTDGKLADPEEAAAAETSNEPTSNVYECGECGFTLFIAQGRESKFFGTDFKCPECGAPKDKFKARDDVDE